ncbi:DUF418 domain-containing protein [Bacillus ndiopicus]|uniref:DUF418 domain-containing protein n=1 Tax=Bacillus ndiopicus TaxID=1347368 RepID=UPI0005AAF5B5|nr:heparan-alpha-glucosaminide N-acetyltransferase domain-containing protein [Bacillus ndiopicus]
MTKRIEGLDAARALAMFGMLIVNFTVITGADTSGQSFLQVFMHLFEGRASATFVILAGIGISLLTKRAYLSKEPALIRDKRTAIQKRALFLFVLGLLLYIVGWTGDILHYYGMYMLIASLCIMLSAKWLFSISAIITVVAQFLQIKYNYLFGWDPQQPLLLYLDFWTPEGFLRNLFFNGYHPILPWISFFLIGMGLGRFDLSSKKIQKSLLIFSISSCILCEGLSRRLQHVSLSFLDNDSAAFLFGTGPIPPNIFYIASNTASSIVIIVLTLQLCEKLANNIIVKTLIHTGQLSLTHYVAHIFIGVSILELLGRSQNQSLAFVLGFTTVYFFITMLLSFIWRRKFSRGPVEWCMRKIA